MAWARMVAVVVPSPATSLVLEATSLTIWAPMFSNLSLNSISLATVTPSLVMVGPPNDFSSNTLRPLGPKVTLTASASLLTPSKMDSRALFPYFRSFAMILSPYNFDWNYWNYRLALHPACGGAYPQCGFLCTITYKEKLAFPPLRREHHPRA